jgi:hypothetical protein
VAAWLGIRDFRGGSANLGADPKANDTIDCS